MANYLENALLRLVEMEKECIDNTLTTAGGVLVAPNGCDAVPYALHWQGSFPYWTNAITESQIEPEPDSGQDYEYRFYTATLRLRIGLSTEGTPGELEARLYACWPVIENYFNARSGERMFLTSDVYPEALDEMSPIGAHCTGCRVVLEPQGGVGAGTVAASVLSIEVTLEIPFHIELD